MYCRPTLQTALDITRRTFFVMDRIVLRITGSAVILGNAKASLSRVLAASFPMLTGTWLNATQEDASVHAITQLTRVQISLLSSSAALENSEQPRAQLLANATAVLQVLLSDISDSENQMKTKSMDIALKYAPFYYLVENSPGRRSSPAL